MPVIALDDDADRAPGRDPAFAKVGLAAAEELRGDIKNRIGPLEARHMAVPSTPHVAPKADVLQPTENVLYPFFRQARSCASALHGALPPVAGETRQPKKENL